MSAKDYEQAMVAVLRPAGFARFKSRREWRREKAGFLEEVDLQKFRWEPVWTVNFAVRHQKTRLRLSEVAGVGSGEASFPISERLGNFLGPMDLSWREDDPHGPAVVQDLIRTRLLPYFEMVETVQPYIDQLTKLYGRGWGSVTPRLELAILLHETGAPHAARQMLSDPPAKLGPEQLARVSAVYRDLFGAEP